MITLSTTALLLIVLSSNLALDLILSGLLFVRRGTPAGRTLLPLGISLAELPLVILQATGNISLPTAAHLFLPAAGTLLLVILLLRERRSHRKADAQPSGTEADDDPSAFVDDILDDLRNDRKPNPESYRAGDIAWRAFYFDALHILLERTPVHGVTFDPNSKRDRDFIPDGELPCRRWDRKTIRVIRLSEFDPSKVVLTVADENGPIDSQFDATSEENYEKLYCYVYNKLTRKAPAALEWSLSLARDREAAIKELDGILAGQ